MDLIEDKQRLDQDRVRVGISHGDINGIGYEIILKTFQDARILENITPVIYGSVKVAAYHRKVLGMPEFQFNTIRNAASALPRRPNIINISNDDDKVELGHSTSLAGKLSFQALEAAVSDLLEKHIDVLVTAPINKQNIQSAGFQFPGHTEYLARKAEAADHLMLMVCDKLRIGVVTGHIPLREVSQALSVDTIVRKTEVMHHSLVRDFGLRRPKIALLGLNPHAGEEGVLGSEDTAIILPAAEKAREKGLLVYGPYPADGFFGSDSFTKFDGILAMYHDQGMIPFKALAFDRGVNFTAGLSIVRTSPAHGTAYDIAGKNEASPDSFREAIFLAVDIFRHRREFDELTSRPLPNYLKDLESSGDAVIDKEIPPASNDLPDNIIPEATTFA